MINQLACSRNIFSSLILFLLILLIPACSKKGDKKYSYQDEINYKLKNWESKNLKLPPSLDTLVFVNTISNDTKYTIIHLVNGDCACHIDEVEEWHKNVTNLSIKRDHMSVTVIIYSKSGSEFEKANYPEKFQGNIVADPGNKVQQENRIINDYVNTFLLNDEGMVLKAFDIKAGPEFQPLFSYLENTLH